MTTETGKEAERTDNGGSMSLTGHLREMRNRIIVCIVMFAAGCCFSDYGCCSDDLSVRNQYMAEQADEAQRFGISFII